MARLHERELFRVASFLVVGATVALFNLAEVFLLQHQHLLPYVAYVTLATEGSIFASFLLNDGLTFRALARGGRRWWLRCVRFHGASAVGAIFTIVLSTAIYHGLHLRPVVSQCIALAFATVVNFSMHRFWTYRVKPATA